MAKPDQNGIDKVLSRCDKSENSGELTYPGMSYEQRVKTAIMRLQGNSDEAPFD